MIAILTPKSDVKVVLMLIREGRIGTGVGLVSEDGHAVTVCDVVNSIKWQHTWTFIHRAKWRQQGKGGLW